MRPEFGCAVHDFVFDAIDAELIGTVETAVHKALARWEPRIEVIGPGLRPLRHPRTGKLVHHDHLRGAGDQPPVQPRLSVLRDPGRGDRVTLGVRPARRPRTHDELVSRGAPARGAAVPRAGGQRGRPIPPPTLIELFTWMTGLAIERLGRVPDKLHVALLDLLGIQLDGPAAARTELRMRLSAPARRAARDPRRHGGRNAAHRLRRSRSSSRTVGDVHDPAAAAGGVRRAARRGGEGDRRGRRRRLPDGPRSDPVQPPAPDRRRALPGVRRRACRDCSCGSRWRPRWRAAPASSPMTPRCAGRSARATAPGPQCRRARGPHRRLQLRLGHR